MRPTQTLLRLFFLAILWFGPGPALLYPQAEPVLTVQGTSQVEVEPDVATVRLGVVRQEPTAEAAQQGVNQIASQAIRAIREAGIAERFIQTARLTLAPVYSRQRAVTDTPEIAAYRASNTVSVRVEDLDLVGEVIDAGLEAGANELQGVTFGLRDELAAREEALERAIAEARSKAEVMAEALDVRLDGLLSVDEGGVFVQVPRIEGGGIATLQADVATPVSPGEVTVSASVTLRYRIAGD